MKIKKGTAVVSNTTGCVRAIERVLDGMVYLDQAPKPKDAASLNIIVRTADIYTDGQAHQDGWNVVQ